MCIQLDAFNAGPTCLGVVVLSFTERFASRDAFYGSKRFKRSVHFVHQVLVGLVVCVGEG